MKLVLAKDWGDHKNGDTLEIIDESVIEAGKSQGLFVEAKKVNKTDKKEV